VSGWRESAGQTPLRTPREWAAQAADRPRRGQDSGRDPDGEAIFGQPHERPLKRRGAREGVESSQHERDGRTDKRAEDHGSRRTGKETSQSTPAVETVLEVPGPRRLRQRAG